MHPTVSSRSRKFVRPKLQRKLLAMVAAFACVSALVQVIVVDLAMMHAAEKAGASGQALLVDLPQVLTVSVLISLGLTLPVVIFGALTLSFRILGPAHRFEQHLRGIANGEAASKCTIRESDELHELCSAINDAVGALSEQVEGAAPLDDQRRAA
ncbi:MAG: hypothetical protein GY930_15485 [bacterium]|nr:hypothetical protein [bacterium]